MTSFLDVPLVGECFSRIASIPLCNITVDGFFTLSGPLPGESDDPVDVGPPAEVDHPDGLVDVVVVHDGAVGEVGVGVAVHREGGVTVAPLLPRVLLVVRPGVLAESLVRYLKLR